ncbi:GNAT family N-acetyltransferase [Micromonospora echinaurantiaca]|uniref:GNAT family N-acetyltransferase n=1 Tax=Micromonospora echinaurantiaca TaxID=47857 RepID=UPI0037B7131A
MSLSLEPMSAAQLARLRVPLERSYAEALAGTGDLTPEAARAQVALQVGRLLPDGAATADVLLRVAVVNGVEVGWIWVTLPGGDHPNTAWIHNIEVHPGHRGQGYARRMIQLVEAELARLGVGRLGLNVFGDNTGAIRLYESLGFQVITQQMAKSVDPVG